MHVSDRLRIASVSPSCAWLRSGWTAQKLARACGHTALAQLLGLLSERRSADRRLSGRDQHHPGLSDGKAGKLGNGAGMQSPTAGKQDSEAGIRKTQTNVSTSPTAHQIVRNAFKGSGIFDALPSSRYSADKGAQCLPARLTCPVSFISLA